MPKAEDVADVVREAKAKGWRVFSREKHTVALDGETIFYLGGGVEAPRWDQMREVE